MPLLVAGQFAYREATRQTLSSGSVTVFRGNRMMGDAAAPRSALLGALDVVSQGRGEAVEEMTERYTRDS
jgi:hypothetical protein